MIEALGMCLPGSSSAPNIHPDKQKEARESGSVIKALIEKDLKPRDIMTRKAFENALTTTLSLGGSTNMVLHMLAVAKSAQVPLCLDDF